MLRVAVLGRRIAAHPRAAIQHALGPVIACRLARLHSKLAEKVLKNKLSAPFPEKMEDPMTELFGSSFLDYIGQNLVGIDREIYDTAQRFNLLATNLVERNSTNQPTFSQLSLTDKQKVSNFRHWALNLLKASAPRLDTYIQEKLDALLDKMPLLGCAYISRLCLQLRNSTKLVNSKKTADFLAFQTSMNELIELADWFELADDELLEVIFLNPGLAVLSMEKAINDHQHESAFAEYLKRVTAEGSDIHPYLFVHLSAVVTRSIRGITPKIAHTTMTKLFSECVVRLYDHTQHNFLDKQIPMNVLYEFTMLANFIKETLPEGNLPEVNVWENGNSFLKQVQNPEKQLTATTKYGQMLQAIFSFTEEYSDTQKSTKSKKVSKKVVEKVMVKNPRVGQLLPLLNLEVQKFFSSMNGSFPSSYMKNLMETTPPLQAHHMTRITTLVSLAKSTGYAPKRRQVTFQNYYGFNILVQESAYQPLIDYLDQKLAGPASNLKQIRPQSWETFPAEETSLSLLAQKMGGFLRNAAALVSSTNQICNYEMMDNTIGKMIQLADSLRKSELPGISEEKNREIFKKLAILIFRELQVTFPSKRTIHYTHLLICKGVLQMRLRAYGCQYVDFRTFTKLKHRTKLDESSLDGILNTELLNVLELTKECNLSKAFEAIKDPNFFELPQVFLDGEQYLKQFVNPEKDQSSENRLNQYILKSRLIKESFLAPTPTKIEGINREVLCLRPNLAVLACTEIDPAIDGVGLKEPFQDIKLWSSEFLKKRTSIIKLFQSTGNSTAALAINLAWRGYHVLFLPTGYTEYAFTYGDSVKQLENLLEEFDKNQKKLEKAQRVKEKKSLESSETNPSNTTDTTQQATVPEVKPKKPRSPRKPKQDPKESTAEQLPT